MKQSTEQVADELRRHIVAKYLPGDDPDDLANDVPLRATSVLDSLSLLEVILHVEQHYGVIADPYEATTEFESVGRIAAFIARKKAA